LSQVLKFLNIRIRVSGEGAKALFYLREVSERKGDMDPHNAFRSSHFLERVDGNWLTGGSVRASGGGLMGSWGARGQIEGQREGQKEGWKKGQKGPEWGPIVEQWEPVADMVGAQSLLWARHGFYKRGSLGKLVYMWEFPLGWNCLRVQEILLEVELPLGLSCLGEAPFLKK
jgi:hypothetical protein